MLLRDVAEFIRAIGSDFKENLGENDTEVATVDLRSVETGSPMTGEAFGLRAEALW